MCVCSRVRLPESERREARRGPRRLAADQNFVYSRSVHTYYYVLEYTFLSLTIVSFYPFFQQVMGPGHLFFCFWVIV